MAHTIIHTPDPNINAAFLRLPAFLEKYKVDPADPHAWAPGVPGYGIDKRCAKVQDTRDNRWLVWAARYHEPDDEYIAEAAPRILSDAFDAEGWLHHHKAVGDRDDHLHHYVWWLLQVALAYEYTGYTTLDTARIRRIIEVLYKCYDTEHIGLLHTQYSYFVTSIGEPSNTDRRQAYGFFNACNMIYSLGVFAELARARNEESLVDYFLTLRKRMAAHLPRFLDEHGCYYALIDCQTGERRYRVTGEDGPCQMTDNVFFPLAFGVLDEASLRPSLDFLLPELMRCFPVPYAVPGYCGEGTQGWWIPRSWQECLAHYCLGLREMEMPSPVWNAIKQQSDRFATDDEVWEHYDPETGSPHDYYVPARIGYATTSACLNIAIIEALFGLRPASPGFASVSIRPDLPGEWDHASLETMVNGRRFILRMKQSEKEVSWDFCGSDEVPARLILPLPAQWKGHPIQSCMDGTIRPMKNEDRFCLEVNARLGNLQVMVNG